MEKLYCTQVMSLQPVQVYQKLSYPRRGATPAVYSVTNQAHIYIYIKPTYAKEIQLFVHRSLFSCSVLLYSIDTEIWTTNILLIKTVCSTYPKLDSSPNLWIGFQLQLGAVCTLHLHLDLIGKLHLILCSANKRQLQLLAVSLQALHANQYHEGMDSSFTYCQVPTIINVNVNHSWKWLRGTHYGYCFCLVPEKKAKRISSLISTITIQCTRQNQTLITNHLNFIK